MKFPSRLPVFAVATGLMLLPLGSNAAVIYNEGVSADLDGSQILLLTIGVNSVFGTSEYSLPAGGGGQSDADDFLLDLAPGQAITSITYRIASQNANAFTLSTDYEIRASTPPNAPTLATTVINVLSFSPQPMFASGLPLGASGSYIFDHRGFAISFPGGTDGGGSWSYTIDINVAEVPVPIPAAAWLLGSSLIGLLGIRRRNRS